MSKILEQKIRETVESASPYNNYELGIIKALTTLFREEVREILGEIQKANHDPKVNDIVEATIKVDTALFNIRNRYLGEEGKNE